MILTKHQLEDLIYTCAGAATRPLLEDHPNYIFPSERVKDAVDYAMTDYLSRPYNPNGGSTTSRISREDLFMEIARAFSLRSTCLRGQTGCIAVQDNHIVSHGYNGAPAGMPHCIDVGECGGGVHKAITGEVDRGIAEQDYVEYPNGCTRSIHAEANMVAYAARMGASLEGATVYMLTAPCLPCAQLLVASGIGHMYYEEPYRLPQGLELIDKANIVVEQYHG